MTPVQIGINGFGRIGRCVFRYALRHPDRCRVVGINEIADFETSAYLARHDSVFGLWPELVVEDAALAVGDQQFPFFSERDPREIPWGDVGTDVVIESTGALRSRDDAGKHLHGGAKRVIVSAPADDADATFVLGVNHEDYDPADHHVVSLASCTTNCLAPVVKVLHDEFGIDNVLFTTVHAYTSSQKIVDGPARKLRRGRAAPVNIIPTSTGAAKATERVLPELDGRIHGMAMRVPVPDGSVTDLVALLKSEVEADEVNDALRRAAGSESMRGILGVSDEELVSHDIVGDPRSAVVDAKSTMVHERSAKVIAWYDNEFGYSARCVDFAAFMAERGLG